MRVVLLKGHSSYEVLRVFVDEIAAAFERRGAEVRVIDLLESGGFSNALPRAAAEGSADLVYSLNIGSDYRDAQGRDISTILGAPHISHLVDHPFSHLNRVEAAGPMSALLTIDQSHADAIDAAFAPGRFGFVGFCPHAAIGAPRPIAVDAAAYGEERPIPVLFAGTFYKAGEPQWVGLAPGLRRIFDDATDMAMSAEWMSATLALDAAMRAHGLDPDSPEHRAFRIHSGAVHEHVRQHRRFEALKSAARAGVPLHVYGSGYEKHLYRFKNIVYGGKADFHDVLRLMGQSRVVLNLNANFGAGSHERPLTALMAGAAAWTDASAFYDDHFREGEELGVFRWRALDEGMADLAELSRDPARARALAQAGQARVVAEHRWDHRLPTIIAAADAVRKGQVA
jgi:hypothetical protein